MHENYREMDEIEAESQSSESPEGRVLQDASRVGWNGKPRRQTQMNSVFPSFSLRSVETDETFHVNGPEFVLSLRQSLNPMSTNRM